MRCTERNEMPAAFHGAPRPVRRLVRRIGAGQRDHARHGLGRNRRLAGLAGLVAQPAVHAFFGEALLPAPDHRAADAELPRDLLHRSAVNRGDHDLRPLYVFPPAVAVRRDRLQPLPVPRAYQHANCLCHPARFARHQVSVNRQNASEHSSTQDVTPMLHHPRIGPERLTQNA